MISNPVPVIESTVLESSVELVTEKKPQQKALQETELVQRVIQKGPLSSSTFQSVPVSDKILLPPRKKGVMRVKVVSSEYFKKMMYELSANGRKRKMQEFFFL